MKIGGNRNFGYGRSLVYAAKNVLKERYGDGCFQTRYFNRARLKRFFRFLREQGIRDLRDVKQSDIELYARYLRDQVCDELLATSTAVNHLSSVNVLMSTARKDDELTISPAQHIGRREYVRRTPPKAIDLARVEEATRSLEAAGHLRTALAIQICRKLGTRAREACLLDLRRALRGFRRTGTIRIEKGTKGGRGRSVLREVQAPEDLIERINLTVSVVDGPNLVPVGTRFKDWYMKSYRVWRNVAQSYDLESGFHDLRRGFACSRYKELTGCDAPCVAGYRQASKETDLHARERIADELGHGRVDVVCAYVGGRR